MTYPLKQIDLVAASCDKPVEAMLALRHCMKFFDFGRAVLFSTVPWSLPDIEVIRIPPINHWREYNEFMLQLHRYVYNEFVMVVQDDGYIINPANWTDAFLDYDYLGAPWPIEENWIAHQPADMIPMLRATLPLNRVGNGGFSLRSRKFLEFSAQFSSCLGYPEDMFLCLNEYERATQAGLRFAPVELAAVFSYETPLAEFGTSCRDRVVLDINQHFGFHGNQFHNAKQLIDLKRG
jgi:hypothetical protein